MRQGQMASAVLYMERAAAALLGCSVADLRRDVMEDLGLDLTDDQFIAQYIYGEE